MTPDEFLECLPNWMKEGAEGGGGGLCLLRIDRATQLREQLGFSGLRVLMAQVSERLETLDFDQLTVLSTGWASMLIALREGGDAVWVESLERLRKVLCDSAYQAGGEELALTFSSASARFDHRFTTPDEMLLAVYQGVEAIEEKGGNDHAELEPGVSARKALDSRDHMLGLLMEALRSGNMKVVFQPLLATDNAEPYDSHQMLPRLQGSDGTLIPAAEFLPQAREAALLPVLDRWMVLHAIRLLQGPLRGRALRLFLNQSEALLEDSERMDWLAEQFERLPELAGRIVIEIRHEDALSHLRAAHRLIEIARGSEASVCVSMVDEHGRWDLLSSDLNCEFIRMSPGFVARLTQDQSLEERFMALSQGARGQGTRIIVPMIEDRETAASMWRSGVDFMQGNMIQAPEDTI